ncbi:lymphocyte antigen 6L [Loxodonta africana]|uniref:lymphocyte antigen 6L n=1 Tax=Loxodonta africana TaxID=9785 RepID=UPI00054062AD
MEGFVLVLWALLVSAEFAGICGDTTKPGNLSCYKCFKVQSPSACYPLVCSSEDTVCVSHEMAIIFEAKVVTRISKRCAPRCPNSNSQYEWVIQEGVNARLTRGCCSRNLCNKVAPAHEGPWALHGGLLLLWVLL